jgi:hypothetical protein
MQNDGAQVAEERIRAKLFKPLDSLEGRIAARTKSKSKPKPKPEPEPKSTLQNDDTVASSKLANKDTEAPVTSKDSESPVMREDAEFPMTSEELQKAIDDRMLNIDRRTRSYGQLPTNMLRKMQRKMAGQDPSDDQLDDDFLESIRNDMAEWEETGDEVQGEVSDKRESPAEAETPSLKVGMPDDAGLPPNADVPVDDATKHMP